MRRARQSAETAFRAVLGSDASIAVAQPQRVFTPEGQAAYWLVASVRGGRVQALARILPDGRVATVGPSKGIESDAAQVATGLTGERTRLGPCWFMTALSGERRGFTL